MIDHKCVEISSLIECPFAGASTFMGLWRFGNSLDSCVDHILTLEGSRIQLELAKL